MGQRPDLCWEPFLTFHGRHRIQHCRQKKGHTGVCGYKPGSEAAKWEAKLRSVKRFEPSRPMTKEERAEYDRLRERAISVHAVERIQRAEARAAAAEARLSEVLEDLPDVPPSAHTTPLPTAPSVSRARRERPAPEVIVRRRSG